MIIRRPSLKSEALNIIAGMSPRGLARAQGAQRGVTQKLLLQDFLQGRAARAELSHRNEPS